MRDNGKNINFWFIILVACAISKSTAKYSNSIDALLDKLYSNEELSGNRIVFRSSELSKKPILNERNASKIPHTSQNIGGGRADLMTRFNDYLAKIIFKKSKTAKMLGNPTKSPMAIGASIYNNTLLSLSKGELKNVRLANDNGNVNCLTSINAGYLSKNRVGNKTNRSQKNPSLMHCILNPFFLKGLRRNNISSKKKEKIVIHTTNSTAKSKKMNKSYTTYSSSQNTVTKITPVKYNSLNEDWSLVTKLPLLHSKPPSVVDNLESPYYRSKSAEGKYFKMFRKNLEDVWSGRKMGNKTNISALRSKSNEENCVSKPARLEDMVKRDDSMGTLLNQTLLNFSSQIFGLLHEPEPANHREENTKLIESNKFWSTIKKKIIGGTRINHSNLSYEVIRSSNDSKCSNNSNWRW